MPGAQVIGPSIGGAILQLAGGAAAATLDGVSYVISGFAILVSRPALAPERRVERGGLSRTGRTGRVGMFDEIGEGLRRVAGDRILRDLAGSTGVFNLGSGMLLAVVVLFATRDIGLDAAGFGLIYGLGNVGFIIGALSVGVLTKRAGIGRTFAWSTYTTALAMILIALAGGPSGALLLLAGRFIGAAATPLFNVNALSLRQARSSDAIMGRVNATFLFIDWGPLPVGSLLGGGLATAFGPRAALIAAAGCGVVSAIWIRWSPASRLTSLSELAADSHGQEGQAAADLVRTDGDEQRPALDPPMVA